MVALTIHVIELSRARVKAACEAFARATFVYVKT
jgi:hypothetical protein